ncbi:hypothetical protein FA95DRAFT_815928 [Auriscalpium vulgare]|uniref:Uncharacterized protein n=1 Tax=Auriscalpium vulgare TaxID=40419 RepID=A0ACB8S0N1_9AGAM|nr:hypothetical protein FA95DRAFT_815928 [Auriscalpium vulgare]
MVGQSVAVARVLARPVRPARAFRQRRAARPPTLTPPSSTVSSSMAKKRKRAQREQEVDEYVDPVSSPAGPEEDELPQVPQPDAVEPEDVEQPSDKELEIWETFKEEYHETFEMLPLYLHRSYTLLRELDQQAMKHYNDILPSVMSYIQLRQSLAGQKEVEAIPEHEDASQMKKEQDGSRHETSGHVSREDSVWAPSSWAVSQRASHPPDEPASTIPLLQRISVLTEEALRASEEKASLAQAAQDSVDRHIRLLDQAIKEQETALAVGLRQGTHPSLLPDIVVPRLTRQRIVHSPIPGFDDVEDDGGSHPVEPAPKPSKKRKAARSHKKKGPAKDVGSNAAQGMTIKRLKLKVPPIAAVLEGDTNTPVDPNEPRYCYCGGVSYGDMVACDGENCQREWFHLACAALNELPASSEKWFCQDCQVKPERHSTRRRPR